MMKGPPKYKHRITVPYDEGAILEFSKDNILN